MLFLFSFIYSSSNPKLNFAYCLLNVLSSLEKRRDSETEMVLWLGSVVYPKGSCEEGLVLASGSVGRWYKL